ncbi:hypothetical protein Natoc_3062 [Natronococcus occultus SP4]|uniref:Small CPxCG-related zinc finger protein n=1 Tax=Natronococcus occultus SP4 TaxID=694430 RepID=L0K1F9_9EURY|nr:hypothetical protein Natoc_3062 [Natronococcus occultus SP4]
MTQSIPTQCPECGSLDVRVTKLSPSEHDQGDEWATRVACRGCTEYVEWFN